MPRHSLTMVGWTELGHKIQSLSNLCPNPVQWLSNKMWSTSPVHSLSKKVQCLYSSCPTRGCMDGYWTWKSRICPKIVQNWMLRSHLDILWTNTGLRLTLDRHEIVHNLTKARGQTLDKHGTWTNSGQSLDLISCNQRPIAHWTDSGQTLDLDKV